MSKYKIRLDTQSDVLRFVNIASTFEKPVYLTNGTNLRVSGQSLLGAIYTLEWDDLWVESEADIYTNISNFVV